jgi:hypothetical protein
MLAETVGAQARLMASETAKSAKSEIWLTTQFRRTGLRRQNSLLTGKMQGFFSHLVRFGDFASL